MTKRKILSFDIVCWIKEKILNLHEYYYSEFFNKE